MIRVVFVDHGGMIREVEGHEGSSVMDAAMKNNIPGIDGDCGGACACGTCQIYVDPAWLETLDPPEEMELDMLAFVARPQANSRLSCQIKMSASLDGLVVRTPETQQ